MKQGALWHDGRPLIGTVTRAATPLQRMRGLLGSEALPPGSGLLLTQCRAVHTVGMRFTLDLLFLDRRWRVVRTVAAVTPGALCVWGGWRASHTVEITAGWLPLEQLAGATLEWRWQDQHI